jgi:hypothetical protein
MQNEASITVNGKKVELKFGMTATRLFLERHEKHPVYNGEFLTPYGIAALLYSGHEFHSVLLDIEEIATFAEVSDYVDESLANSQLKDIQTAIEVWRNTPFVKKFFSAPAEKSTKKTRVEKLKK